MYFPFQGLDASGSVDSLKTHAESVPHSMSSEPKSPVSSLSAAIDIFLIRPTLTCKTKRKPKESYNSQAVCNTDDDFVE